MALAGNLVGAALALEMLKSGKLKFKPKFGLGAIGAWIFLILMTVMFMALLVWGILIVNVEMVLSGIVGIVCFGYLFLISPYGQSAKNYRIEFPHDDSLADFELFYRGKLVKIRYKVDQSGKIMFADNQHKLNCVAYADGANMGNFTKYRILNYFGKWLHDNDLFSGEITTTFEEL